MTPEQYRRIGELVVQILDFSGSWDMMKLNIGYLQCGDEDPEGNYTPPHYSVEAESAITYDSRNSALGLGTHSELLRALEEVWEDLTSEDKQKEND